MTGWEPGAAVGEAAPPGAPLGPHTAPCRAELFPRPASPLLVLRRRLTEGRGGSRGSGVSGQQAALGAALLFLLPASQCRSRHGEGVVQLRVGAEGGGQEGGGEQPGADPAAGRQGEGGGHGAAGGGRQPRGSAVPGSPLGRGASGTRPHAGAVSLIVLWWFGFYLFLFFLKPPRSHNARTGRE